MTLRDVKQFGTEGRRNGQNEVPAEDGVMTRVKFKVELIQEFNVVEAPEEDPAIIESSNDSHPEKKEFKK